MILVLAGGAEGRSIVESLSSAGYGVLVCAATPYGAKLLQGSGALGVSGSPLDREAMLNLIQAEKVEMVVDATHPYAEKISSTALQVCREMNIRYIRYQRPPSVLPGHRLLHRARDYREAAAKACELGDVIFLATGSKTLEVFIEEAAKKGCRVVARVLPQPEVLQKCLELGLAPSDLVAMQGPYSLELNLALLRHYGAGVMVTKDGGAPGGTDAKIAAAFQLGIPVVLVERPEPPPDAVDNLAGLLETIRRV